MGKIVSAVRYRLADDDRVLVSVNCDEELADIHDDCCRGHPSASTSAHMSSTGAAGATLLVLSGKSPPPQDASAAGSDRVIRPTVIELSIIN